MAGRLEENMNSPTPKNGPLIQLITAGLSIWVKSQLEEVQELRLELKGSALDLFKGRISGVKLTAQKIKYQGICLEIANLESGPLNVNINFRKPSQTINLKESFKVINS